MYPPHTEGIGEHSSNIFHMSPLPKLQVSLCHGVPGAALVGTGSKIDRLSSRPHYGQGNLRARLAWLWFGCDTEWYGMVNTVGARPVALKTSTFTIGGHSNALVALLQDLGWMLWRRSCVTALATTTSWAPRLLADR